MLTVDLAIRNSKLIITLFTPVAARIAASSRTVALYNTLRHDIVASIELQKQVSKRRYQVHEKFNIASLSHKLEVEKVGKDYRS